MFDATPRTSPRTAFQNIRDIFSAISFKVIQKFNDLFSFFSFSSGNEALALTKLLNHDRFKTLVPNVNCSFMRTTVCERKTLLRNAQTHNKLYMASRPLLKLSAIVSFKLVSHYIETYFTELVVYLRLAHNTSTNVGN